MRIFAAGNRPDSFIALRQIGKSDYFSVKPGESAHQTFASLDSVEQIKSQYPQIEDILKSETVSCRLALKRADLSDVSKAWIDSPVRILTAQDQDEMMAEAVKVARSMKIN